MPLKIETTNIIEESEWSRFVSEVYGRPYDFQQQDECRARGVFSLTVPSPSWTPEDEEDMNDEIPEEVNGEIMGVKFAAWLARDPKQPLKDKPDDKSGLQLWWARNFYPAPETVAKDLFDKGLLPAGEYLIHIDW